MEEKQRYWEEVSGFISENDIDKRWILRDPDDEKAHGSLRIVSHPDLKPGYLRAFAVFVTKRKPKTDQEIIDSINEYKMHETELEIYSVNEHIETQEIIHEERYQDLEELFGVKIFD